MLIRDESRLFIEACKSNIQRARGLVDYAIRLREETMILQEECIAEKGKSLAILQLTNQYQDLKHQSENDVSSIGDDTLILQQMIEEIKQSHITDTNPLHELRARLLGLSFIPDIRD